MSKVIVHIDLNAFFVRAEEIKDSSLENQPVAVGHEGRAGIVSTCSYEARKFGVRSGMPMFKAKELCPNLIIKSVDFNWYKTLSREFITFVKSYTRKVEIASVDECFADFTENIRGVKNVEQYFLQFQKELFYKTKLKCSIGIGPTKFLAKMGSDYKKPMGLTIIRKKDIAKILFPLPIEDMFGIGKKSAPRMTELGINTIGDLYRELNIENSEVNKHLGKFSFELKQWLSGNGSDEISMEPWDPKSIGHSSTLMHDTDDLNDIKEMLSRLAKEVSEGAKKENKIGNTVQIIAKETNFRVHNKSVKLSDFTNDYKVIFNKAMSLYEKNFTGLLVRQVGITLQNLISPKDLVVQMNFFDYEKHEEESTTKLLINELNRKLDKPALKRASELEIKKKEK